MALILDGLACRRSGRTVFAGLSFTLPGGTAALLRGPNGSGKSSLLRVIAGLLPPAAGDVRLSDGRLDDGRQGGGRPGEVSLARDPGAMQEKVAFAGHLDAVKPALTVAENLALWAGVFGARRGLAEAALERFGLAGMAGRPAGQCSAGQRRRLGLARLVVIDRPLWLLDEPTVSLDAGSTALVADLVREHAGRGGMALIATHIDLGLGAVPVLDMAEARPATAAPAPEDDFLKGSWA